MFTTKFFCLKPTNTTKRVPERHKNRTKGVVGHVQVDHSNINISQGRLFLSHKNGKRQEASEHDDKQQEIWHQARRT